MVLPMLPNILGYSCLYGWQSPIVTLTLLKILQTQEVAPQNTLTFSLNPFATLV